MYYHNDRKLPLDQGFTLNEISYPANWLRLASSDAKEAVGIEWREPPVLTFKNEKFYYNRVKDGVVISTPKDLDMLKRTMTAQANRTAHSLLSGSDWIIVRWKENGDAPDEDWLEYRTAVRAEANRQCDHINDASDIDSLETLNFNWPEDPAFKADRERREADEEAARLEREEND